MKFFLGTHETSWLADSDVPLFVSHRRLAKRVRLPVAKTAWALDSGGFSELRMYGSWKTEPRQYIRAVRQYQRQIGRLVWAAPMDWMCDAPDVPWIPVLQGWTLEDYLSCVARYETVGIRLTDEPLVGVGSVCRRQDTYEVEAIFRHLAHLGIRCHGFGVKTLGLKLYSRYLTSADSMAWSYSARCTDPLPGCSHKNCANCRKFAFQWRQQMLARIDETQEV